MKINYKILVSAISLLTCVTSMAQTLVLPDPLVSNSGQKITNSDMWKTMRRQEILTLFANNVYGQMPKNFDSISFTLKKEDTMAMGGTAKLKEIAINVSRNGQTVTINLILFIPKNVIKPPVFLLINNRGKENTDPTRAVKSEFWPAEQVIARGYAIAAIQTSDMAPDNNSSYTQAVLRLYPEQLSINNGMKAIGAWAWGAMRAMDYFDRDPDIDRTKVAVVGHSRGGKAALWAGAQDERFATVISNNSGEGGAAISRRMVGESILDLNTTFPYWFCNNYRNFNSNVNALPVDHHELIALMAPRAVYVASASQDDWADPVGEFLSMKHAEPVYALFGLKPLPVSTQPPVNTPVKSEKMGYHLREGAHNLLLYDWQRFMDFVPIGTPAHNIPGKIEAENYSAMSGVQVENTTDTGGGKSIGYIDAGDWMDYNVNVSAAGTYTIKYRVASQTGGGKIILRKGSTDYHTVDVPTTGGWQTWTTVSASATLQAGQQTLRIYAQSAGWNLNWFEGVSGTGNVSPTASITSPANNATFTAPASIGISASASDSNGTVSNVQFFSGSTSLGTDTSSPYSITWSSVAAGAYSLTARATDNGGAATTSAGVNVTVNGTSSGGATAVYRINAGGPAVSPFTADSNFSGGTGASTTATINLTGVTNPAPAAVYQTERYGNVTYTFGSLTANTSHTVRLHFAETWHSAAGSRKFDVSINGTQVLNDYDVYAAAGAKNKAVITQHTATANASGQIVIQFTNVVDNAKISGIEIIKN